jgi:DNA replication protein DnaC
VSTAPPPLAADLTDGLKRLKLAAMRRLAPELLVTAKTQRWSPEEFLRTLVAAEITARDESNARTRMRSAAFPVSKTLAEFDVGASSIPAATFDYLASLESIRAAENVCLIGPAGTGKSHMLVALGVAAVEAGHRVRYFTAAELVENLYRALADNSVGRVIDTLLRNDLIICDELGFAPLDDTGAQLLFRFVAAAYERRALGIGSHWPFESWGRFLPEHTTAVSLLDRLLHHCHAVVTDGDSYRMKQARARTWPRPGTGTWPLTRCVALDLVDSPVVRCRARTAAVTPLRQGSTMAAAAVSDMTLRSSWLGSRSTLDSGVAGSVVSGCRNRDCEGGRISEPIWPAPTALSTRHGA